MYKTKTIRLSEPLLDSLQQLAKKDKRSLSNYIEIALENHLRIVQTDVKR